MGVSALHPPQSPQPLRAPSYNLFCRKDERALCCAVREDRVVPDFVIPEQWEFIGTVRDPSSAPPGFKEQPARLGVRFCGFYLFQAHDGR